MSTRTPESNCPQCGKTMDAASCPFEEDASPSPGDLYICIHCGQILTFDASLMLAIPSLDVLMALSPETSAQLDKIQQAIRKLPAGLRR